MPQLSPFYAAIRYFDPSDFNGFQPRKEKKRIKRIKENKRDIKRGAAGATPAFIYLLGVSDFRGSVTSTDSEASNQKSESCDPSIKQLELT